MSDASDADDIVLVNLLDEGTPVWLQTPAKMIARGVFLLLQPLDYDPGDYTMEFLPGTRVRCERTTVHGGNEYWAAVEIWSD